MLCKCVNSEGDSAVSKINKAVYLNAEKRNRGQKLQKMIQVTVWK